MYLTESEYAAIYGVGMDAQTFNNLRVRAESEIDMRTFGRIPALWETMSPAIQDKIKNAVAELINEMFAGPEPSGKRVKSESVGSHSVTYEYGPDDMPGVDYGAVVSRHLGHTGLLFRGVYYAN